MSDASLIRGDGDLKITGFAALDRAGAGDLTFLENSKYLEDLDQTEASACICSPRHADRVPERLAVLTADKPQQAYLACMSELYPEPDLVHGAFLPAEDQRTPSGEETAKQVVHADWISSAAYVDPAAELEDGVRVEPGAVIADRTQIGKGTIIGANAVIGSGVAIGRNCVIGSNATVQFALLGDRVILHPGVRIGQDGYGFQASPQGHKKIPQLGRVIIQDAVEIGANTTVDRGANRDTVIGEGTKIDNLVQIAHNVEIGRHCLLVAQVGISGSAKLGDYVALGGQAGVSGHVSIGDRSQIAATSAVKDDVPPDSTWGGTPARPILEWLREVAILKKLAQKKQPSWFGPKNE